MFRAHITYFWGKHTLKIEGIVPISETFFAILSNAPAVYYNMVLVTNVFGLLFDKLGDGDALLSHPIHLHFLIGQHEISMLFLDKFVISCSKNNLTTIHHTSLALNFDFPNAKEIESIVDGVARHIIGLGSK